MKTLILTLLLGANTFAFAHDEAEGFKERVSSSDASVRLGALQELARLIAKDPAKAGNDVIPVLCNALSDGDAKVREYAAAGLAIIAMRTQPRFLPNQSGFPDLRNFAPLKADLEAVMFDSDPQVRRSIWGTYAFTFDLSPELQAKLIAQFPLAIKTGLQDGLIEILSWCERPTPATEAFLTQLLDDPQNGPFVIESFSKRLPSPKVAPPPAEALPKFAAMLMKESQSEKRQALARVLGRYGAQARPYVDMIERLRDSERDPVTQSNLKRAAETIRAGRPLQE
jgi:hypothetical protein